MAGPPVFWLWLGIDLARAIQVPLSQESGWFSKAFAMLLQDLPGDDCSAEHGQGLAEHLAPLAVELDVFV